MDVSLVTNPCLEVDLEAIAARASEVGFDALEIDASPVDAEIPPDATVLDAERAAADPSHAHDIADLLDSYGLDISVLAYQDVDHLHPDPAVRQQHHDHLENVIRTAAILDVPTVGTFIGRNPTAGFDEALAEATEVWPDLLEIAESHGVQIAIENAPMDHIHPHGINVFHNPYAWDELFAALDSDALGLSYDPSHLYWQDIEYCQPLEKFAGRIFNAHAKDTEIRSHRLNELGILPNRGMTDSHWWRYRLPGLGELDWSAYLGALHDIGFDGALGLEHEDAAFAFYGPFSEPPTADPERSTAIERFWEGIEIGYAHLDPLRGT